MAYIRVDLQMTAFNGQAVTFKSPASCVGVEGLKVYYPAADGTETSKTFSLADAHGNNVGSIDLFAANVIVKVILDTEASMAFVQNADTNAYLEGKFVEVGNEAKGYTDQKIAAIPTPDVSGQINAHNTNTNAHGDIRTAVSAAATAASNAASAAGAAQTAANSKASTVTYTGTIGTSWTEDEDAGAKTQSVAISGMLASDDGVQVDHYYGEADYAAFVAAENEYLDFITNGYAETYNGGIKFTIFGDANTVSIPIVVKVVR